MVLALRPGSSRVTTAMPSASFAHLTAGADDSLAVLTRPACSASSAGCRPPPSLMSDPLHDRGDPHAAAHAQGGQAPAQVAALQLVDEGAEDHRPGGAEGVAHGDRAAVDVGLLVGDPHVL